MHAPGPQTGGTQCVPCARRSFYDILIHRYLRHIRLPTTPPDIGARITNRFRRCFGMAGLAHAIAPAAATAPAHIAASWFDVGSDRRQPPARVWRCLGAIARGAPTRVR